MRRKKKVGIVLMFVLLTVDKLSAMDGGLLKVGVTNAFGFGAGYVSGYFGKGIPKDKKLVDKNAILLKQGEIPVLEKDVRIALNLAKTKKLPKNLVFALVAHGAAEGYIKAQREENTGNSWKEGLEKLFPGEDYSNLKSFRDYLIKKGGYNKGFIDGKKAGEKQFVEKLARLFPGEFGINDKDYPDNWFERCLGDQWAIMKFARVHPGYENGKKAIKGKLVLQSLNQASNLYGIVECLLAFNDEFAPKDGLLKTYLEDWKKRFKDDAKKVFSGKVKLVKNVPKGVLSPDQLFETDLINFLNEEAKKVRKKARKKLIKTVSRVFSGVYKEENPKSKFGKWFKGQLKENFVPKPPFTLKAEKK